MQINRSYSKMIQLFSAGKNAELLKGSKHGLERECLRINKDGTLADTLHPKKFGAALTNPYISTDFAEVQLEMITPPFTSEDKALKFLCDTELYVQDNLKNDEILWPSSMPCILPKNPHDIRISTFGKSELAAEKNLYRKGLSNRYGSRMQTISGIHYNFSFSDKFWKYLMNEMKLDLPKKDFISHSYMHMARNFIRLSWLDSYLFGSSPMIDKSFLDHPHKILKKHEENTFYGPFATSLRTSEIGYCCAAQSELKVSFNDVDSYISDLQKATKTAHPKYKNIKDQISDAVIQSPAEYYSGIRPKRVVPFYGDMLERIKDEGIEYLEVRSADLSPEHLYGVDREQLHFLHVVLVYSLFISSPEMSTKEHVDCTMNHNQVSLYGRKEGLKIKKEGKEILMKKWGRDVLKEMLQIAKILDKANKTKKYTENILAQLEKIEDPEKTPSAVIMNTVINSKKSFVEYCTDKAISYSEEFKTRHAYKDKCEMFAMAAEYSMAERDRIEFFDFPVRKEYAKLELSTQLLIKSAKKRGIKVEILDAGDNFIRLSKGRLSHVIKQATHCSAESLLSYFVMENKNVTRILLKEKGINVPEGGGYDSEEEALTGFSKYKGKKIVIKPATTNYGIGINFLQTHEIEEYKKLIEEAFTHSKSVVVEEFVEGNEYRFFVVDGKTVAVAERIPASVTGDGINTIRGLIKQKNTDPKFRRSYVYPVKIDATVHKTLKENGLTLSSILPKNKKLFLRENTNVSTGGEAVNVTEETKPKFKRIAEKAAKILDSKICGVDMIIKGNSYSIIEANFNPSIQMHAYPHRGEPIYIAENILDLLGF